MMSVQDKFIERNPLKCFNMPSLIGKRLTVFDVVNQIFREESMDWVTETFELSEQQVKAALLYCSARICETDCMNGCNFCNGCRLRGIQDNDTFDRSCYDEIDYGDGRIITISKIDQKVIPVSLEELELECIGRETWVEAEIVLKKYFLDAASRESPGI